MKIRFWGVRGSVAASGPQMARIGGNTSCLDVESQGFRLILDGGTGLRALGDALAKEAPVKAALLFSHLHWDHVQGFPFFAPAYLASSELRLFGPGSEGAQALQSVLARQMEAPSFPVPLSAMRAKMTFETAQSGQRIDWGPFVITPIELPHPQGCLGYHIEADGQRFAYCTDVELTPAGLATPVAQALDGVQALVLDAQYTPDEYEGRSGAPKRGWGHSTNIDAATIARDLSVQRLFLFHHDPGHNDEKVEAMAEAAKRVMPTAEAAREGLSVQLAA